MHYKRYTSTAVSDDFLQTSIHGVLGFIFHREDAAKLTASGDDDPIHRQEPRPSEYLTGERVQINAQITPLHTDSSTLSSQQQEHFSGHFLWPFYRAFAESIPIDLSALGDDLQRVQLSDLQYCVSGRLEVFWHAEGSLRALCER